MLEKKMKQTKMQKVKNSPTVDTLLKKKILILFHVDPKKTRKSHFIL